MKRGMLGKAIAGAVLGLFMFTNAFGANCVAWVKQNRAPWLKGDFTTLAQKKKAINVKDIDKGKPGYVVVMNYSDWGHFGSLKSVDKKGRITIEESNFPWGKEYNIRTDYPKNLRVLGYIKK